MIADIFITTKDRPDLLSQTLESLALKTDRSSYRLTVVQDGDWPGVDDVVQKYQDLDVVDYYLWNRKNQGLGPSINQALAHIDVLNRYYDDPMCRDASKVAPFVCYVQDDVRFIGTWLNMLATRFMLYERQHKLGFASGVECIEHPIKKDLGNGMVLKDWIRATNMFARREYWMSMFPIPRFDPETAQVRAKPNDGRGSSVDWWFVRDHANSVCKTGRTNLVIPGLVVHAGYDKSTWLDRELPESDSDKEFVKKGY